MVGGSLSVKYIPMSEKPGGPYKGCKASNDANVCKDLIINKLTLLDGTAYLQDAWSFIYLACLQFD